MVVRCGSTRPRTSRARVVVARVAVVVVASAEMAAAAAVVVAAAGKAARASLNAMTRPGSLRAFFFLRLPLALLWMAAVPVRAAGGDACADLEGLLAASAGPGATLLVSYPTAPPGPLAQAAFVYDNAVATIALLGCG